MRCGAEILTNFTVMLFVASIIPEEKVSFNVDNVRVCKILVRLIILLLYSL